MTAPAFDLYLTKEQLATLAIFTSSKNSLSPFTTYASPNTAARISNPEIITSTGDLVPELQPVVDCLASPARTFHLSVLNTSQLMDVAFFFPGFAPEIPLVALSNDNGKLRLQSPAPYNDILHNARLLLGPSPSTFRSMEATFDLVEAWLVWGILDHFRQSDVPLKPEILKEKLKESFKGFTSLSGYFRETLNLNLPTQSEFDKAVLRLIQHSIIESSPEGLKPCDSLLEIARDYAHPAAHVHFKVNSIDSRERVSTVQYWAIQGKSNALLLWYEVDRKVYIRSVPPGEVIKLLLAAMVNPPAESSRGETTVLQDSQNQGQSETMIPPVSIAPPVASRGQPLRYSPPKKPKSAFPRVLLSLLLGLGSLVAALFGAGFLRFSPGSGVALVPEGDQPSTQVSPTPQTPASTQPTPAATQATAMSLSDLSIDRVNSYIRDGVLNVLGRVTNNGTSGAGELYLRVEYYDTGNKVIHTNYTNAMSFEVGPGEFTYFTAQFPDAPSSFSRLEVFVNDFYPASIGPSTKLLAAQNTNLYDIEYYDIYLIGELINTSDTPLQVVNIYAVFSDFEGKLVYISDALDYRCQLNPGENLPFKVWAQNPQIPDIGGYEIVAEAYPIPSMDPPLLSLSANQNIFLDDGSWLIAGELLNTASRPLEVNGLSASFYDENGALLDVTYSYIGVPLAAGEVTSYLLSGWDLLRSGVLGTVQPANYVLLVTDYSAQAIEGKVVVLPVAETNRLVDYDGLGVTVTVQVTNDTSATASSGTAVFSLRDKQSGNLVSVGNAYFYDLAPGASTEVTAYLPTPANFSIDQLDLDYRVSTVIP
jgi:hypothetical protein